MRPRITPMKSRSRQKPEIQSPHNDGDSLDDLCIVGAGVAGLSAAIFSARRGLSVLMLSTEIGGQTASTAEIENYPGLGKIEGPDLIARMAQEARAFGCVFQTDTIGVCQSIGGLTLEGARGVYRCRAVIIATGKSQRRLGVPGEQELLGRGVFYAGALDLEPFRGRRCAVIGGGSSALDCAARLSSVASRVTLIHRRDRFGGEQILEERVRNARSVNIFLNTTVGAILGDERVIGISVNTGSEENTLDVDAVVIAIGFEPRSSVYAAVVDCDEQGRIIIDHSCTTSAEGIFAAGDCTTVPYQQIVISAGEGAKAALSAYRYLLEKDGKRSIRVDWGFV